MWQLPSVQRCAAGGRVPELARMAATAGPAMLAELLPRSAADNGGGGARVRMCSRNLDIWPCDCRFMPTDRLARQHPFANDRRIVFLEEPHVYFILRPDATARQLASLESLDDMQQLEVLPAFADRVSLSVTGLVHAPFPAFDARHILGRMSAEKKRQKYGTADDRAIARAWQRDNTAKADTGTGVHAAMEIYFNTGYWSRDPRIQIELQQGRRFVAWLEAHNLEVVRTEPTVWVPIALPDEDAVYLAGSVDCLARHRTTHEWYILDWKRTGKELVPTKNGAFGWGTGKFAQVEHLPFHHYSLQLHLYRAMLQSPGYGLTIPSQNLYLVRFHPKTASGSFELVPCADYAAYADELLTNYTLYRDLHMEHKRHEADMRQWMTAS